MSKVDLVKFPLLPTEILEMIPRFHHSPFFDHGSGLLTQCLLLRSRKIPQHLLRELVHILIIEADFGGEEKLVSFARLFDEPADNPFGLSSTVSGGRIDIINTMLQSRLNEGYELIPIPGRGAVHHL